MPSSDRTAATLVNGMLGGAQPKHLAGARLHFLVRFESRPGERLLVELMRRGVAVLDYIPETSIVVSAPDESALEGLHALSVRPLTAAEKISALVPVGDLHSRSAVTAGGQTMPFVVTFHRDVPQASARELAASEGLAIRENPLLLRNDLLLEGTPSQAASLAAWDEVEFVYAASDDLAAGRRVYACSGAQTTYGPVAQMISAVGDGWDGPGRGSVKLGYFLGALASGLPRPAVQHEIERALAEWSRYVDVDFFPAAQPALPRTLAFMYARRGHGDAFPFDGPGRVLAHTFYPAPPNPETIAGDLHFDDEEFWGIGQGIDVYSVVLHELGHALGLGHSDRPGTVMYPYYAQAAGLSSDDIAAIRMLYAARASGTQPADPADPGAPQTPVNPEPPGEPQDPTSPPDNPKPPENPTDPGAPKPPAGEPDTAPPVLTLISPAAASISTYDDAVTIRGSARDDNGVAEITWTDSIGNGGVAQGTAFWTAGPLPLRIGTNTITIHAQDLSGNTSWRSVVITRRHR